MTPSTLKRELLAEYLGTFVLIAFGCGNVAQVVLSKQQNGTYLSINLAWGFAVTMGIYIAGGVSGAHLNPAVTLAMALTRGFPKSKVLPFSIAQIAGAFTAAATVFLIYREAFNAYDGGTRMVTGALATAGIFSTYPQPFLSTLGGLADQIFGTALLLMVIAAIGDTRINKTENLSPLIVGFLVAVIGMSFGLNAGYAINPARDLGPRLFTFIGGWGGDVFTAGNHWFWVPIFGPLIGGPLGVVVYDLFIGNQMKK